MVNKVQGAGLGTQQTVTTETSRSPDLKDRRRHNDDSKHTHKVQMEQERIARQREANEMLRKHPARDPRYHYDTEKLKLAGYAPSSITNIQNMPCGLPSSTPAENLHPLEHHLRYEKHISDNG